ncbi:NADH-quinone oxidoreductase subunit N [Microbispora hainanensis]|uniref:NADH-quinone oxidoreductase subunit N n=1 Tax=Microbispora hainanensis TaxID=568844 RepID=UPI002E2847AF|nr:NADH-quinone oxidoreductase subunit N [Microbispora hainanensis]
MTGGSMTGGGVLGGVFGGGVMDGGVIQSIDYAAVAAPLILALVAGLVLLLDAFLPARPGGARVLGLVTLGGMVAALAVVAVQAASGGARRTFCVPASLGGASALGQPATGQPVAGMAATGRIAAGQAATDQIAMGQSALGQSALGQSAAGQAAMGRGVAASCSLVADRFSLLIAAVVLAAGVVVVLLSMTEIATARDAGSDKRVPAGEWHFLLLATLTGAVLLPASRDLIMLVVSLELVSLPVFALTALRRHDGRAAEAALKLFLVSVVSTAITLFGVSLLYGVTGSVHLDRIDAALRTAGGMTGGAAGGVTGDSIGDSIGDTAGDLAGAAAGGTAGDMARVAVVAIVLVAAGFAFKIAAVPFHFWAGDVYQGAPVPVAALLSVVSKASGFAGLILLLTYALPGRAAVWAPGVAVVAALTMTAGNVLAMRQRAAVRLLAWSSVAQSGYILAPLAVYAVAPRAAVGASVAYLVFYAAMNLIAFAVVLLVARLPGGQDLEAYRGLALRSPAAGLSLAFALVCLAGLPPGLAGLFAKIVVFRAVVDGGLGWLALVMAANTVVGLYYYIAWTARLFAPPAAGESRTVSARAAAGAAVAVTVAVTVVFSVAPQVVLSVTG